MSDFYDNSWRLVPANVIWGAALIALWIGFSIAPPLILLAPLLAFPTAAIFRIAALVGRGEGASFWDGPAAWRTYLVPILLLGTALAGCMAVFLVNIAFGLLSGSVLGWVIATLAFWGLVVTWLLAWTSWPVLLDPARADRPIRDRLRTAALLVVAFPVRIAALGGLLAVLLLVSAVTVIVLLTASVALAALVATRFVLPAADRLDQRLERVAASEPG
jgi:hypothetical protein